MAVRCARCGREYDVTLFEFGHTVTCDCGNVVDLGRTAPRSQVHRVTVYVKGSGECPLCEEAVRELEGFRRHLALELTVVAIDGDPSLKSAFENDVPVVFVDGRLRFRGRIVRHVLEALLAAPPPGP